jgi:rod shape-determining protein MreC
MNIFSRHKNTVVLATVLLAQFLALAVQVKRQTADGPVRVIRLLAVSAISPFERLFIYSGSNIRGIWANYIDLRNVRHDNLRLKAESEQMRLDRAREQEDARQARRLQALLEFKEQWIDKTVAAQVIGTSGMETSRLLYIDKGSKDGIKADMAVITPNGVVGKILAVYGDTSQVLMINDPTSGVGATLVNSRLQGIAKGTPEGEIQLNYIMSDEPVQAGDMLITSGGDHVFPKGLTIGSVAKVNTGRSLFLEIKVKPIVELNRLEEVLVITEQKLRAPDTTGLGPIRASDILAQHLPGVPQTPAGMDPLHPGQPAAQSGTQPGTQPGTPAQNAPTVGGTAKAAATTAKPATAQAGTNTTNSQATKPQTTKQPTAGTTAGPTAAPKATGSKPATPKPIATKPASPNADGAKPKSAASEGAR